MLQIAMVMTDTNTNTHTHIYTSHSHIHIHTYIHTYSSLALCPWCFGSPWSSRQSSETGQTWASFWVSRCVHVDIICMYTCICMYMYVYLCCWADMGILLGIQVCACLYHMYVSACIRVYICVCAHSADMRVFLNDLRYSMLCMWMRVCVHLLIQLHTYLHAHMCVCTY